NIEDNQTSWSKSLNNRKNQNPRQNTKITETEEPYSKKIDRKLSRLQMTNTQQNTKVLKTKVYNIEASLKKKTNYRVEEIAKYCQIAILQNFLKINIVRENPINPILLIDWGLHNHNNK
ncbi:22848_t:CDS:1, partial [Gigaspora margarita]